MKTRLLTISLTATIIASGCGGGGGSTPPGKTQQTPGPDEDIVRYDQLDDLEAASNWQDLMRVEPGSISTEARKAGYWGYAVDEYNGVLTPTTLTEESIYQFWKILEENRTNYRRVYPAYPDAFTDLNVEAYDDELGATSSQGVVSFNDALRCNGYGFDTVSETTELSTLPDGYATFTGALDKGAGNAAIDFNHCFVDGYHLSGETFISGYPSFWYNSHFVFEGESYLKTLVYLNEYREYSLSGFQSYRSERDDDGYPVHEVAETALVYQDSETGTNFLRRLREEHLADGQLVSRDGALAIGNLGSVAVEYKAHETPADATTATDYPRFTYIFTGSGNAMASFTQYRFGYFKVELDENGDGTPEFARFFTQYSTTYGESSTSDIRLFPASEVSHPPVIKVQPQWERYPFIGGGAAIRFMAAEDYFDPDTASEDLVLTITWTINNEIVPELQNSLIMEEDYPLEKGDTIRVAMTVSDSNNTIQLDTLETRVVF